VLILGMDTSGRQGSVALLRAEGEELQTLELMPIPGGQYSELLVPSIAELLVRHGFEKSSIGLIAVASGPGSFTGLRIAIATVKGLSEAFAIPVVSVSVLEAVALTSGVQGRVLSALDAQRSEVFYAEYNVVSAEPVPVDRELIASFADFAGFLANAPTRKIFTPDSSLAVRLQEAGFPTGLITRPSAETYARIAHRKFLVGVRADVAVLDANYVRRSDAEIFVAPKIV